MMSRPEVPNFNGRVAENAVGFSQYRPSLPEEKPSRGVIPLKDENGSTPVASARWVTYDRVVRFVELTLRWTPLCQDAIAFSCHPPTIRSAALLTSPSSRLPRPNGSS